MTTFVNEATSKGANVILDPHNFERYYPSLTQNFQSTTAGLVGGTVANSKGVVVTNAMFADFWGKVADQFKNNPKVIFNLMNEPNSVNLNTLVGSENAAIAAIRATGATNLILVPGTSFTGGWTWTNGNGSFGASNATAMLNIVDSGNNFAFDVHQYLDSDGSGTHTTIGGKVNPSDAADDPDATQLGKDRLTAVTNWLIANGRKGFLGEFAVDNSMIGTGAGQIGDETLTNMLNYIQDPSGNGSTPWMGFTWWGGGPFWANNSNFHIDPVNGVDQADMTFLKNGGYLAGVPEPTSAMILGVFCLGLGLKRRSRAAA